VVKGAVARLTFEGVEENDLGAVEPAGEAVARPAAPASATTNLAPVRTAAGAAALAVDAVAAGPLAATAFNRRRRSSPTCISRLPAPPSLA